MGPVPGRLVGLGGGEAKGCDDRGTPWVEASRPIAEMPAWAIYERALFDALDHAASSYESHYCEDDGSLRYPGELPDRDGVDDFYEAFSNFPLLYLLGGSCELLSSAEHHWEAITRQLDAMGYLVEEYERGYDWFHQGESLLFFYGLCIADPGNAAFAERLRRFADLYVDERKGNYDPTLNIIRAPHNGGGGARRGIDDPPLGFPWRASMARYGLPVVGVLGIDSYEDLQRPLAAAAMGRAIDEQIGRGDVAVNLLATTLVTLAFLSTREERYREWVIRYIDGWLERAAANGGVVPDNVGLGGGVGETLQGRWFGGHYGWMWPHGLESVGSAVVVAGTNAALLTADVSYLRMARAVLDEVIGRGIHAPIVGTEMSQPEHWLGQYGPERCSKPTFLVPHRYGPNGWFDYQPMHLILPFTVWQASGEGHDFARLVELRDKSGYAFGEYRPFRNKHDAGHEDSWLEYLLGCNSSYPEVALAKVLGEVNCRLDKMRADQEDERPFDIHRWQEVNPVTTELLLQLTTGSPSPVYNGGLPQMRLRYFDAEAGRPGLPAGVAALVSRVESGRLTVELMNTSVDAERRLFIQAGTFAEDRIEAVRHDEFVGGGTWPGERKSYELPVPTVAEVARAVGTSRLGVTLPPGTAITLDLDIARHVEPPSL